MTDPNDGAVTTPSADGRNVLVVVLDTVRKDHLTPYGYDRPTTPWLARFAEDVPTLAESLSAAGYATACYSSNAWVTPYTRLTAGFTDRSPWAHWFPRSRLVRGRVSITPAALSTPIDTARC